jgi:hypothetical protein
VNLNYTEEFEDSNLAITTGGLFSSDGSGVALKRYGECEIRFSIAADQELHVYVDAGTGVLPGTSSPPTITIKEVGFFTPALFQGQCREEGKVPQLQVNL